MSLKIPDGYANSVYSFICSSSSKIFTTALGYVNDGTTSMAEDAQIFYDVWLDTLRQTTCADVALVRIECHTAETGGEHIQTAFGTSLKQAGDLWSCAIIKKLTAGRGQAHRGRMFMPGILSDPNMQTNGQVDPDEVTGIQTTVDEWYTALQAAGGGIVLLHNEGTALEDSPDPITSLVMSRNVGVQRRRRMMT